MPIGGAKSFRADNQHQIKVMSRKAENRRQLNGNAFNVVQGRGRQAGASNPHAGALGL
jgi:hypothetical protein